MSITATESDEYSPIQHDTYKNRNDPNRRTNFTRSPSLEKIIRFNTYICSQNFFLLPSILVWLRTSQTVLGSYAEKSIATIKSTVFNSIFYKIVEAQFLIIATAFKDVSISEPGKILPALKTILTEIRRSVGSLSERIKRKILKAMVYFSFFYIFLQLALCLWTLSWGSVPLGLTFLLVCLTIVSYANYQCLRFVIVQQMLKREAKENPATSTHVSRRGYVRTRDILGKRTISHVNLF